MSSNTRSLPPFNPFLPKYVIGDKGYSGDKLRRAIRQHYHATQVIDANPAHKRAAKRQTKEPAFEMLLNRRSAIERLNGWPKAHHKLNSVRVRGKFKVRVYVFMSTLTLIAQALASGSRISVRKVASSDV